MGTFFAISPYASSFPATTSRATCVSISPGFTALTRMPRLTYSRAAVRVVEGGVKPAELGDGLLHHCGHLGVVAHVAANGESLAAGGDQFLGRRLHGVLFEVRQDDGRARLRECPRRRQPHAGCRPGD